MSQRFTVSKSDGDRRPSDIQGGEVNQLFEGDEPETSGGAEGEAAAGAEVVVVLKADRSEQYLNSSSLAWAHDPVSIDPERSVSSGGSASRCG